MSRSTELTAEIEAIEIAPVTDGETLEWRSLFGRTACVAIEIGTGNGLLLAHEAAREPGMNFLGIEREPEFYYKMIKRVARNDLTNVRTYRGDGLELLNSVPTSSVARLYCYFSDPWPKRRHAARRVLNEANLPLLERVLSDGGELWVKTDVPFYFNFAVTALRQQSDWRFLRIGPLDDFDSDGVVTNFERKAREAGSRIWGFQARLSKREFHKANLHGQTSA